MEGTEPPCVAWASPRVRSRSAEEGPRRQRGAETARSGISLAAAKAIYLEIFTQPTLVLIRGTTLPPSLSPSR